MGGDKKEKKATYKTVTVRTIDGTTIHGKVNVSSKERASEFFASKDELFVVLVDVAYSDHRDKTLFINKNHIVWVEPED